MQSWIENNFLIILKHYSTVFLYLLWVLRCLLLFLCNCSSPFSLISLKIFSLSLVFCNFSIMCLGMGLFSFIWLGICCSSLLESCFSSSWKIQNLYLFKISFVPFSLFFLTGIPLEYILNSIIHSYVPLNISFISSILSLNFW